MTIAHVTAARAELAEKIADLVDTGSGIALLRLRDGSTTLVDFELESPAYSSDSAGSITILGTPIFGIAEATGEADGFQVISRDGDVIYSGSVTGYGAGGDLEVTNTSITSGIRYSLAGHTYTASA